MNSRHDSRCCVQQLAVAIDLSNASRGGGESATERTPAREGLRGREALRHSSLVHHEGELAMVVGRRAKRVSEEDFHDVIFGYACANDVTARDIQRREGKYTRGKGFDTVFPFGPR